MNEQDKFGQDETQQDRQTPPTGEQRDPAANEGGVQPTSSSSDVAQTTGGEIEQDGETLTEQTTTTDSIGAGLEPDAGSQPTGENQGGFVGSKGEEGGDAYLREDETSEKKSDIEGSSDFGTNGE